MVVTVDNGRRQRASARSFKTIIDFAVGSHMRAVALLLLVALLSFLPGFFSIPPIDRDEARFAQATKQMVESGDYIDIRFQDEVRYKKPVGIYWLQGGVVKAARALGFERALTTIWLYRVPSLVGAIGAVLLTYWAALAFVSRRAAVLAGLMMASCVLLGIERLIAKTDAMLLLTVVAAMGAMARAYLSDHREAHQPAVAWMLAGVFWSALAIGVLLKGPLIVMITGLAAGALIGVDRSARWLWTLKPIAGIVWLALLVLPWFLAIVARAGDTFFAEVGRAGLARQGFRGPGIAWRSARHLFRAVLADVLAGCDVGGIGGAGDLEVATRARGQVPAGLAGALMAGAGAGADQAAALRAAALSAIAMLIAGAIDAHLLSRRPFLVWGTIWWFVVPVLAGLAGIVAIAVIGRQFGLLVWLLMGGAAVMGFLAWRLYQTDGAEHSLLRAIAAAVLTAIAIFALVVPSLGQLFPSVMLARILRDSGCAQPAAAAVGYQEPSLVFLAGTATRLTDTAGAAEFLRGGECRFAFIESLARSAASRSARKPSDCAIPPGLAWKRSISATDSRSRSRPTVRRIRRDRERSFQIHAGPECAAAAMDACERRPVFRIF